MNSSTSRDIQANDGTYTGSNTLGTTRDDNYLI